MTPEQHRRVGELWDAVLGLPESSRESFLEAECDGDLDLKAKVLRLLDAERDAPDSFLAKRAIDVAAGMVAEIADLGDLKPGTRLGAYRIEGLIGRGGMGAVYSGFDSKLLRKAAIKILPIPFAGDPDRVRRFQREAQAASQLNHPNIVSIYDADFDGGYSYIAAELVDGVTLRDMIAAGPTPGKSVVEIGTQICAALGAAHDAGIVHRDIKPENIMVRPDGIVKILDFGLAKLLEPSGSGRRVVTHTQPGAVAGTLHYMSPEQVTGQRCGPPSDIFSAAVVLFELTTGVRPFDGPTDGAIFSHIVSSAPANVEALSTRGGKGLEEVILRALQKDPELRFQTAHDLRAALRLLSHSAQASAVPLETAAPAKSRGDRRRWPWLVAAALFGMAVSSAFWYAARPKLPVQVPTAFERMTLGDGDELFPNLFPDGKQFLYASSARGHWDIYLQRTGGSAAINLTPDSPADDSEPALSHDGMSIAFRSEREGGGLFVMEATGEHPRRIAADGHLPQWSPDGKLIAYCDSTFVMPQDRGATVSRLHVLDVATGKERQLITGDAVQPNWSPNGVRIAYWGVYSGGKRQIFTVRARGNSSTPIPVTTGASVDVNPVWSPSGRELYFISDRGGTMNVWRVAIDEESGQVTGDPQPVTMPAPYIQSMSWSQDGSKILYSQGRSQIGLYSVDFDPVGLRVTGPPVLARAGGNQNVGNFRLSPDGGRIVYDTVGDPNEDLWIANIDGSGRRKLTSDVYRDRLPSWSPSGDQILFISNRGGNGYQEYLIRPDGSGLRAITMSGKPVNAGVWLDDGKTIVASLFQHGLARLDLQGTLPARELQHLPDTPSSKGSYAFVSPAENGLLIGHINGTGENPVVMYSLAEGKLTRLGVKGVRPAWIPGTKNRYFLFLREDACYLYDRRSGEERRLFQTPHDQLYFLQLAPGARQIYVTRATRDLQIWMADFPK